MESSLYYSLSESLVIFVICMPTILTNHNTGLAALIRSWTMFWKRCLQRKSQIRTERLMSRKHFHFW